MKASQNFNWMAAGLLICTWMVWTPQSGLAQSSTQAPAAAASEMKKEMQEPQQEEAPAEQADDEEGFESLFDGETLDGWKGNTDLWSVEDGAITGMTTRETGLKFNQFLAWTGGDVADFELRLDFKIQKGNSGIQFRSKWFDEEAFRVHGYQADIDPSMKYMGILFEEGGRRILAQRSQQVEITEAGKKVVTGATGEDADIVAAISTDDWNQYIIRAKGNHIVQIINGKVTAELTDNQEAKRAMSGLLAFQIHVGPPMKVQFKNIRIKDLSEADEEE